MTNFLKLASASVLALALTACASPTESFDSDSSKTAEKAEMTKPAMAQTNIVEAAAATESLSSLVALVTQAQLVDTLASPGPFTVFAPTNDAFSAVPEATVTALMQDENRKTLQGILTYHVVAGTITSTDLVAAIEANGGSYTAKTVAGGDLTFRIMDGKVKIADANGNLSTVTAADLMQSNGVVHVVNSVLMPN